MDVDTQHNSETDTDYNPDPNDLVNFVADMYQTPGPGAGHAASTVPYVMGGSVGARAMGA